MSNRVEQVADHTPLTISDRDFHRLYEFVHQNYGIDLSQKRQLISGRLSTVVKQKGYKSFTQFIDHLLNTKSEEDLTLLLNKLTTNYTFFMREMGSWDYFRDAIIPEIVQKHRRDRSLAIWSAGCSSGEEPYNISMYLLDYLGGQAKDWDTRVLATDISERALSSARQGVYQLPDTVPPEWKRKYFVPTKDGAYSVAPVLKNNVIFQTFNLMSPIQFRTKFDVIFCRNVMIYFDQPTKNALVQRFYNATNPGGYFLISCSENVGPEVPYRKVSAAVYRKV
jgi:chemotaxis protein methyltransferase CheR